MYEGQTVFLLGGGPTLTDLNLKAIVGRPVIGVNLAYTLGCWVVMTFFADAKFYWWNRDALQAYKGRKVTLNRIAKNNAVTTENEPNLLFMREGKSGRLYSDPDILAWNRSSGAAAINLAVHTGARNIVLLGYDMRRVYDRKNWMPHVQEKTNQNPYEYMLGTLKGLASSAVEMGVRIINATPGSAIDCFEKMDYSEAVKL